ncbi:MAG: ABC transporter permease [Candidatus Aminicenantes bacterium]|nr:ABC transporter permease [Candidatus Aminicenantes bacterium]
MFNIENAIKHWQKTLRKYEAFEAGFITELESHLRDEIDNQINHGASEEQAFEMAVKTIGQADSIGSELNKTHTRRLSGRPPWKPPRFMPALLWNYFKIAFRKIKRQKVFSFINISGLAIGMACCILIFLWVQEELSFDRFHENKDELYRVYTEVQYSDGRINLFATSYFPLARVLKEECPDVKHAARYASRHGLLIKHGEKQFSDDDSGFADPSFLSMFTFPFVKGDPKTALSNKFSVVITEEMSKKIFGSVDPIGKTLNVNNLCDVQVTGIIKDVAHNSYFQFDFIFPYVLYWGPNWTEPSHWGGNPLETFVLLHENALAGEVEQKVTSIKEKHDPSSPGMEEQLHLQPLRQIHFYALGGGGLIIYIYIFSAIAFFIIIIACINFMNLSTARAATRANEVGLRKVVGAKKSDLIKQFFGESVLLSFIALVIALFIVQLILPSFNDLAGKQLKLDFSDNMTIIFGLIIITFFTGILSGSYPALFLSSILPANVLKGTLKAGQKSSLLRKGLVIFQFSISVFLIVCTLIIYKQLNYMRNRELGYEKENLVFVYMQDEIRPKFESIKNELLQNSNIINVTRSLQAPDYIASTVSKLDWKGKNPEERVSMNWDIVGFDYFETFKMEMDEGRRFSRKFATDASEAYIVNEEAVKLMGIESPVGKRLFVFGKEGTIIGIVKNFHFLPLHQEIKPFVYRMDPNWTSAMGCMFSRISPDNASETLKYMEKIFKKSGPDYPFKYQYITERIDRLYRNEQQMGKIVGYFTFLAVFISCLGLFGLASFTAERRTKEVGIRKVLGASVSGIVLLLSKEFTKWVLVANIIACPLAYFIAHKWLENYAYKTSITIWVFILSAGLAFLIALVTVCFQAIKAALSNPVDALRYE